MYACIEMLASQRHSIRLSQINSRLSQIATLDRATWKDKKRNDDDDDRTDEEKRKDDEKRAGEVDALLIERDEVEQQHRAAIASEGGQIEDTTHGEATEYRSLMARASLGAMIANIVQQREQTGAEGEIRKAMGIEDVDHIPTQMLMDRQWEDRAVTPAPGTLGAMQTPIIPYVFPTSAAAHLGVNQPTVPVGEVVYTYVSTPAAIHAPAKNITAGDTTGAFTALKLAPERLQGSYFYNVEDRSSLAGMSEALRKNLGDALQTKSDYQVFRKAATSGVSGSGGFYVGLASPSNPGAEATWQDYKDGATNLVDGRYAQDERGIYMVFGADTYQHGRSKYRAAATDDDGITVLNAMSGGVKVSNHVPDVDSKRQDAIAARARGLMHSVMPIWQSSQILFDPYTKRSEGQEVIDVIMLYNFRIIRSEAYARVRFQVAA